LIIYIYMNEDVYTSLIHSRDRFHDWGYKLYP
jgi:hypothetical protein